jgi:uncharacterized protein YdbL (DUF1318 family)
MMVAVLSLLAVGAWALDLQEAKARGLVGEANTGYLSYVKAPAGAEVKALVDGVNRQRRQMFADTAKANALAVDQVALRFYQRAVQATESGNYYQNPAGQWVRKP